MKKALLVFFVAILAYNGRCSNYIAAVDSPAVQAIIDSFGNVYNTKQQTDSLDQLQVKSSAAWIPVYDDLSKLCKPEKKKKSFCCCCDDTKPDTLFFQVTQVSGTTYNGFAANIFIFGVLKGHTGDTIEFQYNTPFSIRNIQNEKVTRRAFINRLDKTVQDYGINAGSYIHLKDVLLIINETGKAYLPADSYFLLTAIQGKKNAKAKAVTANTDSVKHDVTIIKGVVSKIKDTVAINGLYVKEQNIPDSLAKPIARQKNLLDAADLLAGYRAKDTAFAKIADSLATVKAASSDTGNKGAPPLSDRHTFYFQRSTADIFRASVFSDALALFGKYPNGIIQTEGYLSYHPNVRPVCNTGLIFADYLRVKVTYRRLDDAAATYYMQQNPDSLDRLSFYQRSYLTTDFTFGLFALYFKGIHINSEHLMYLNVGYSADLVNTGFVRDTMPGHPVKDTIYTNGVVAHSPYLNLGLNFNMQQGLAIQFNAYYYWNFISAPRISYFNLDDVLKRTTAITHQTVETANLLKLEAQISYSPGGPHQIFLRSTVTFDTSKAPYRTAYYQLQFGYSVDFSTLISNALKSGSSSSGSTSK